MAQLIQYFKDKVIKYNSQLIFICELGKYLKIGYNDALSLKDVKVAKNIVNSPAIEYLHVAFDMGWVTDIPDDCKILPNYSIIENMQDRFTNVYIYTSSVAPAMPMKTADMHEKEIPLPTYLPIIRLQNDEWLWSASIVGLDANHPLKPYESMMSQCEFFGNTGGGNKAIKWLSAVAYALVEHVKTGHPSKFKIFVTNTFMGNNTLTFIKLRFLDDRLHWFSSGDFLYFREYSDENQPFSPTKSLDQNYRVWLSYNSETNNDINDELYTIPSKRAKLTNFYGSVRQKRRDGTIETHKRPLVVGDIVLLYTRATESQQDDAKQIRSCCLAKVLEITERNITFEEFSPRETYYAGKKRFDALPNETKGYYALNTKKPYELQTSKTTIDFDNLGISHYMKAEDYFIVPLSDAYEQVEITDWIPEHTENVDGTLVIVPEGEQTFTFDQNQVIFWLLCDARKRGYIDFDVARFKKLYFPKSDTAYEYYFGEVK